MDAKWDLKVTGVYEDLPKNSEFAAASYLAPLDRYLNGWARLDGWSNYNMYIYVQVHSEVPMNLVSESIGDLMNPHLPPDQPKQDLFIHPMSKWHLYSKFENKVSVMSDELKFVWLYGIIGAFVLVLACINYVNLTTARSEQRAKEMGIRKTIGSRRIQLAQLFLTQTLITSCLAFIASIVCLVLVLNWFNDIAGKDISIQWSQPWFWLVSLGFIFITTVLAGSYPAIYLSGFNPVRGSEG